MPHINWILWSNKFWKIWLFSFLKEHICWVLSHECPVVVWQPPAFGVMGASSFDGAQSQVHPTPRHRAAVCKDFMDPTSKNHVLESKVILKPLRRSWKTQKFQIQFSFVRPSLFLMPAEEVASWKTGGGIHLATLHCSFYFCFLHWKSHSEPSCYEQPLLLFSVVCLSSPQLASK